MGGASGPANWRHDTGAITNLSGSLSTALGDALYRFDGSDAVTDNLPLFSMSHPVWIVLS
jgi:hypothetical protein